MSRLHSHDRTDTKQQSKCHIFSVLQLQVTGAVSHCPSHDVVRRKLIDSCWLPVVIHGSGVQVFRMECTVFKALIPVVTMHLYYTQVAFNMHLYYTPGNES